MAKLKTIRDLNTITKTGIALVLSLIAYSSVSDSLNLLKINFNPVGAFITLLALFMWLTVFNDYSI